MTEDIQRILDGVTAQIKALEGELNEARAARLKAEKVEDELLSRRTRLYRVQNQLMQALDDARSA